MTGLRRRFRGSPAGMMTSLATGLLVAGATPALAADECGAPVAGRVTCTAAGNPYAGGIRYDAAGDIAVTTNPDVRGTNTLGVTSAAGAATVASGGTVATLAAGSRGIDVSATGAVTVTAAGVTTGSANSAGIVAASATSTVTVTSTSVAVGAAGGPGILATGTGAITITSGAASAVDSAAIYAIGRTGPVSIAVGGATSAGPASDAAIFASSGTTVAVTVAAGATVTGNNAMTLSSETGSTVTNAGTLTGANGYAVMINRGTATLTNTGTVTGRVNFLGNNGAATATSSRFVNNGTFNVTGFSLFGTGAPTFVNTGTVQVLASAPTENLSLVNLSNFANSGTVSLANGRVGDVLTLPGGFTATGASALALDARLGAFTATADRLVIGGAATGTTTVTITNLSLGSGGLAPGTVVIQAGAGTNAGAFQLAAGSTSSGFTAYGLAFNPANNSFTLVGTPSAAAYRPLRMIEGGRNVSNQITDLWAAHMRSQRDAPASNGRLWGGLFGGRDNRRDFERTTVFGQSAVQDLSYHQDYYGAQVGFDLMRPADDGGVTFGLTSGFTHSRQSFRQSADARFDTANLGAYASIGGGPLFFNLMGRYDHYWIDYGDRTIALDRNLRGHSLDAAGELGFRGEAGGFYLEPAVSISYVHTVINDITALASGFDFSGTDGVRGRGGLRVGKLLAQTAGGTLAVYAGGNAVKDFGGRDALLYTSNGTTLSFRGRHVPLYGEGYAGVTFGGGGGIGGFVEGRGSFGRSNAMRGGGARAGIRVAL